MFLKRLELQGFKSFADKVNLDITESITAIVGPNGSGKSNITDSIRWILGEREARNLRGGKGEDLIFAGTKDRPRVGLAQATMHFDNSSGFFPVEFKDVSISRKISRDGTSEFFLNKSEVRLVDIINFFAKSRLGARGLTIISQGQSDTFINATPTERREMIEEILGLKEYQLKKSEAKRRLRNSNFNLEKVKALIDELLPRLRLLKKQAARYEGRAGILVELRGLEDIFYGSRLKNFRGSIAELEPRIKELNSSILKEADTLADLEEKLNKVKTSEPEEENKATLIKSKNEKLLERYSGLQKELGRIEAKIEYESQDKGFKKSDSLRILNEVRSVVENLMREENIDKFKDGLKKILSLIDGPSKNTLTEESDFVKIRSSLTKDLKDIEKELENLRERETELASSLKGFNEEFKNAFISLENQKGKIAGLKEEKSRLLFDRERIDSKMSDLYLQIEEIGRIPREFDNWNNTNVTDSADDEQTLKKMFRLRGELSAIGEIDETVLKEFKETDERHAFLTAQVDDLGKAIADLKSLIKELDYKIHHEFSAAIKNINEEFTKFIHSMFGGGKARLVVEKIESEKNAGESTESATDESAGSESASDT
ncbi:MAG: AAA family ATPase, partial [Candidatus Andersenbacteria bacterium]|nr:AAA family ATPase [Candidatus Andersenbacteria bacterium]